MKNRVINLNLIKHLMVISLTVLFVFINIGFLVKISEAYPNTISPDKEVVFDGDYDWEQPFVNPTDNNSYITYTDYRTNYCTLGSSTCDTDKIIRFDTAEELYRFSVDVSFEEVYPTGNPVEDVKLSDAKIAQILDQHYVLGRDIDYSVMKSKSFIPIGFMFDDLSLEAPGEYDPTVYERYFTGIFDGQGFEIKNLYISAYEYLIYEDTTYDETIEIAMTEYFAMFNYNAGTIKNIGFVDVFSELLAMHVDLLKISNIVGFNMPDPDSWNGTDFDTYGLVENIYVIDTRENVAEAGLKYLVGTSSEDFQASGVVHTNAGTFRNSYYVSKVVVNSNFINRFTVQPVLFSDTGTVILNFGETTQTSVSVTAAGSAIDNLYYDYNAVDEGVYLIGEIDINGDFVTDFEVNTPNDFAEPVSTYNLKHGNFIYQSNSWYFYPDDGYPILKGLDYESGVYKIQDGLDLVFFSELMDKNSVINGKAFSYSDYALTEDIDMGILAPGSYNVPSKVFYGSLSGYNSSGTGLADNFYIHNMILNTGYMTTTEYYIGLFSRLGSGAVVSDLNFVDSTITLTNTDDFYADIFYLGAISGRMSGATIEDVLLDVDIDLGTEAMSKTYVGSVTGLASGIINRVSNSGTINVGNHVFSSSQAIHPTYYVGGIVGSTNSSSKLSLLETVNNGTINGFSTSSDIVLATGSSEITVYTGGVIGYIYNSVLAVHDIVDVSNKGNINLGSVKESEIVQAYQYVGGVFGYLDGFAPILEDESGRRFANLYNEGNLFAEYQASLAQIKAAGIGVSNTLEDTEYALLFNHGTFTYDTTDYVLGDYSFEGATDLFISEYGEGSSYNRWIEIYNGTQFPVDMSEYSYAYDQYKNGTWYSISSLSGTLNPGEVYVIVDSFASSTYEAYADIQFYLDYSGDDAVGLLKNGSLIDIVGVFGQDPGTGWTVNGTANATYDNVIRRKASAYQPTTSWNSSDWEVLGYQSTSSLGTHTSDINFDVDVFSFSDFDYTATIYDVSDSEIDMAITRSYNYADYIYDSPIYVNVSPFYYSLNNNNTSIRYSSNLGNIYYWDNSGLSEIDLVSDTNISGITQNTNVDYLNVHNHGNLNVINVDTGSFSLYISGFSKYLNTDRYIKNSINEGNITFADISGNGNIYVSGLVNFNNSGDLHIKTEPIASEGIMNSINAGNISSTYTQDTTTIFGINGLGNTFVGGLATFNKGSIQDSANLGNITVYNSSTTTTSFSYEESEVLAGLSKSYTGGIVAGGVSSMVIDGNSRIYDSSNNGDVVVMAYQFARAGGVLGVSLYRESTSGGVTSDMGLVDTIQFSILSNGLNFGNISTITSLRADYDYDPIYPTSQDLYISTYVDPDYSGSTTDGTAERPPVYASAGGVIGYGLSVMKNMLNHGIISSTDVAGGVVGATYVLGEDTTVVNITTAVNYGVIQVVDNNDYFSIDGELLTSSYISSYYITGTEREAFLFPLQFSREYIMSKPGFGGIFGRLQRGLDGIMTSSTGAFNFIVNADPNIDLIGRLDQVQNFSSSMRFFRFVGAKYYSARLNDTTPATFSGFIYASRSTVSVRAADVNYLGYTQSGSTYTHRFEIILQDVGSYTLYWQRGNSNETITYFNDYVEINTSSSAIPYSGYTVGSNYTYGNDYYIGVKSIPWITENPNDDRLTEDYNDFTLEVYEEREYIYGPYFPMRTDTTLTDFIYFSEYNLLADRFRKVEDEGEGTNVRENGMYVLSTTAGQEFGSVLPRNISTNDIELIDEDANVSLNIDYENYNFAPEQTVDLYSGILDTYKDLYQTRYNDKAELTDSDLQNLVLVENNGSGTVLDFASIDYTNKIIDYTISLEAFSSLQDTASYRVYDALASANSLIAIRPEDTALSLSQLSTALFDERYDEISTSYPADLEVSIPQTTPTNQMLNLGYLTVYSEAFINNSLFASSDYYNTYLVRVTFLPRPPSNTPIGIYQVAFNGLSPVTPAGAPFDISDTTIDITSAGDVNYDGSLTLYINDGADILDTGYDFSEYFDIYYNSMTEPLNTEYYTVTSTPVDSSGNYIITFDFDDRLASGTYEIVYSYFSASTDYTVVFDKAPSSLANILDLDYYSMSDSLSIIGNQITSDINMGKIPNINNSLTPGENITVKTDNEMAEYLSRVTYDISYMFTDSFVISKFATVTSARLNNTSYSLGYITYEIQYIITAEDGVTSNTYTHTITERSVDLTAAYKNNNDIPFDEMTTTREALNTEFSFDLGFDQSDDMSGPVEYTLDTLEPAYLEVTVTGVDPDSQAYDPSEIVGLSYTASNLLYIDMGYQTLPGTYTFTISYNRGVAGSIIFAQFDITKFEGTTAYLEDMKFSSILNETTYPKIYVSDSSGTPISSPYDPQFYYLGIDYDGADVNGVSNFKVKGRVNNIPLEEYYPFIVEYLPLGSTVARYYESSPGVWEWSNEVGAHSTQQEIAEELTADFAQEGVGDENIAIEYRVTSEDGNSQVYYYVTVNDIVYNLTIIFDIYYCEGEGASESCVLANETSEFNEVVQVNAYNLIVHESNALYPDIVPNYDNPEYYPEFYVISGQNNKMSQFVYTNSGPDYVYRFARNRSGFYIFEVVLPKDQYLNDMYTYTIEFNGFTLEDINDPSFNSFTANKDYSGKYFYIEYSIQNRTRTFSIKIRKTDVTPEYPYGLFDIFKSWG